MSTRASRQPPLRPSSPQPLPRPRPPTRHRRPRRWRPRRSRRHRRRRHRHRRYGSWTWRSKKRRAGDEQRGGGGACAGPPTANCNGEYAAQGTQNGGKTNRKGRRGSAAKAATRPQKGDRLTRRRDAQGRQQPVGRPSRRCCTGGSNKKGGWVALGGEGRMSWGGRGGHGAPPSLAGGGGGTPEPERSAMGPWPLTAMFRPRGDISQVRIRSIILKLTSSRNSKSRY